MPHSLEVKYGLTAQEMLDAIEKRMRLRVALEGAVAEVHFERKLKTATMEGWLAAFEGHDQDGMHDFTISTLGRVTIRVEVKTVRNGSVQQVEVQKTRAAKADPTSRYYGTDQFDLLAVCIGRSTGDWSQFRYALISELPLHKLHERKLQVMHRMVDEQEKPRWFAKLKDTIDAYEHLSSL